MDEKCEQGEAIKAHIEANPLPPLNHFGFYRCHTSEVSPMFHRGPIAESLEELRSAGGHAWDGVGEEKGDG